MTGDDRAKFSPYRWVFIALFWAGASALLLHQFHALKNNDRKLKSQYLKKKKKSLLFRITFAIFSCYENQ